MKMLYTIWPDYEYIDEAIKAGIDTLIVSFYSHPWAKAPDNFDSWETSVSVLERYKGKVKLYACPVVMESWIKVTPGHQFRSGFDYPHVYCPTSQEWMGLIFAPFKDLQNKGLLDGIIYDVEDYVKGAPIYQQPIPCECPRCQGMSHEQQWALRADIFKRDPFNAGQLIYNSKWSMQCYSPGLYLTEDTYGTKGLCDSFKMRRKLEKQKKQSGLNYTIVPGVFLEVFKDLDDFFRQLQYWKKHYGGFWIYNQKCLSKYSKISTAEMDQLERGYGYYERRLIDQVDSNFFSRLREAL